MSDQGDKIPLAACPVCGKPAVEKHRPFCSRRCGLLDLGRWIGGNYRVPEKDEETDDADSPRADDEDAE